MIVRPDAKTTAIGYKKCLENSNGSDSATSTLAFKVSRRARAWLDRIQMRTLTVTVSSRWPPGKWVEMVFGLSSISIVLSPAISGNLVGVVMADGPMAPICRTSICCGKSGTRSWTRGARGELGKITPQRSTRGARFKDAGETEGRIGVHS